MTDEEVLAQYDALPDGTEFISKRKGGYSYKKINKNTIIHIDNKDSISNSVGNKRALLSGSWDIRIPYSVTPKRPIKWV